MGIKILYRYIITELLKVFFVILSGIVIFILISNLVDDIQPLLHFKPQASHLIEYFLFKLPFLAAEASPFAMMLSVLYVFSQFSRHSELNAMKSAGIDFFSVVKPVLFLSLAVSFTAILLNETLVSASYEKANYIRDVLIEKKNGPSLEIRTDLAKLSSGGKVFYIRGFDGLLGTMKGVCVLTLDKNFNITERLDAKEGIWAKDKWILKDTVARTFKDNIEASTVVQKEYELYTKDAPADFIVRKKSIEDTLTVNVFRLWKVIELLKESGFNYNEELTNFHLKFAFPFASFILALLGVSIPFLFATNRSLMYVVLGFVLTILVAFFYMGFVTIGLSMGKVNMLPPMLAAWIANLIFTVLGFLLLLRVKR